MLLLFVLKLGQVLVASRLPPVTHLYCIAAAVGKNYQAIKWGFCHEKAPQSPVE